MMRNLKMLVHCSVFHIFTDHNKSVQSTFQFEYVLIIIAALLLITAALKITFNFLQLEF